MKLGLLQCDHVDAHHRHLAGDYNDMFARWLPGDWRVYDLQAGQFPKPDACDAWICTGSRYSVYDDVEWIRRLAQLVREMEASGKPFIGVCFGHQMMAHALGGRVSRCSRGWGLGVHRFDVRSQEPWMQPPLKSVSLFMSCQDQVDEVPPGSSVLAASEHCPVAIYRRGAMLGIQGHPEWERPYAEADLHEDELTIGGTVVAAAMATLGTPRHSAELSAWAMNWIAAHSR